MAKRATASATGTKKKAAFKKAAKKTKSFEETLWDTANKLLVLAKAVEEVVDDKAKYTDWSQRADIKAELKVDLILLLGKHGYPPVDRDEVYKEIFEQAENFKKYRGAN